MAQGEKTEQPTRKRLRDARRKGQVARSQDLSAALVFCAAVAVVIGLGGYAVLALIGMMQQQFIHAASYHGSLELATTLSELRSAARSLVLTVGPLLGGMFLIALLIGYLQVRGIFAVEPAKPDAKKLNPAEGFKRKFLTLRPYLEMGKSVIKMAIIAALIAWLVRADAGQIVRMVYQPLTVSASYIAGALIAIAWKVALVFLVFGIADFFLQQFLHRRDLRMTKQEVRDEYKETEGNPLHKHARRQRHREILMQHLVAAVRKADAVVVNPTHVAVALKYDGKIMNAPTVTAKGADFMAARMRAVAREAGIPILRDVPLARALYELELEEEIPEELYEAVAVVLRWVYQLAAEKRGVAHA